jgi:hypothetical protein
MNIGIPFFGRKASGTALPLTIEPALRAVVTKPRAPRLDVRRLRILVRPEPTLFQRCLATHMYFAARKSALD